MYGWAGNILRINLTERKVEREPTAHYAEQFIGGRGVGAKLLYDALEPGVDPFDPRNPLLLNVGPLTGTTLAGSGRVDVTARSPLTRLRAKSNFGAYWGPELKYAGYDHLFIRGKADRPVYLWIENDRVEFRDAGHLWGKDTYETQRLIKDELGDPDVKVVCIGPAGEKLVRFACLLTETGDAAGRTGMGAVMGSKNLKAIAVRGTGPVRLARPKEFLDLALKIHQEIRDHPACQELSQWGVVREVKYMYEFSFFPLGAFEEVNWEPIIDNWPGTAYLEKYQLKNVGCFSCPMRCMNFLSVPGLGRGVTSCEPFSGFTGEVWNLDMNVMWEATLLTNKYGMDSSEMAASIAYLMELYHEGIISERETDGIPMERGSKDAILSTIHKIARREGFGDLLAEGQKYAAKHWGPAAEEKLILVKGLSPHGYEMRPYRGTALAAAVGHRGDPLPLRGSLTEYDWNRWPDWWMSVAKEMYGTPEAAVPTSYEGKAMATVISEHTERVPDSLGICKWLYNLFVFQTLDYPVALFRAATGLEVDQNYFLEVGERIRNLERAFDVREGLTRADDALPKKFFKEPLKKGKFAGAVLDEARFEQMKDEYYALRGWDRETGIPTRQKLVELGLADVAEDLSRRGIVLR